MKFIHSKEGLCKALIVSKKNIFLTMTILGLFATMVSPIHAHRNSKRRRDDRRAGTAAGVILGAGAGGAIAAAASRHSAWIIPGLGFGAIGGYLLVRAIRRSRNGRVSHAQKIDTKGRRHIRQQNQTEYAQEQQEEKYRDQ